MANVPLSVITSRLSGDDPPKVSIAMITYNHEKFITQAVESVMTQETEFPYELVIGEDCSTDRTREICLELQRKYPDRIRLILPERNIGIQPNFVQTLRACDGEFIALLEGDDYWTSKEKLQKQVRFLESHPECSSCFHLVTRLCEDGHEPPRTFPFAEKDRRVCSLEQVIVGHVGPTCSIVFRNYFRGHFPGWFCQMAFGDWALGILNAERGLLGYLDENMGVYRIHAGGTWYNSKRVWQLEQFVFLYESLSHYLDAKHHHLVRQCLSRRCYQLSVQYWIYGRTSDSRKAAWRSLIVSPRNPSVSLRKRAKQLILSLMPAFTRIWIGLRRHQTCEVKAEESLR